MSKLLVLSPITNSIKQQLEPRILQISVFFSEFVSNLSYCCRGEGAELLITFNSFSGPVLLLYKKCLL